MFNFDRQENPFVNFLQDIFYQSCNWKDFISRTPSDTICPCIRSLSRFQMKEQGNPLGGRSTWRTVSQGSQDDGRHLVTSRWWPSGGRESDQELSHLNIPTSRINWHWQELKLLNTFPDCPAPTVPAVCHLWAPSVPAEEVMMEQTLPSPASDPGTCPPPAPPVR